MLNERKEPLSNRIFKELPRIVTIIIVNAFANVNTETAPYKRF